VEVLHWVRNVSLKTLTMAGKNVSFDPTFAFERFRQGDGSAFKIYYDHYFPMLFVVIRDYVGRSDIAEDIVSNAFMKLYDRRSRIRDAEHVYGFLFVVARNEAVGHHRDQERRRAVSEAQALLVDREYHDPLEAELERDAWMEKIRQLVEELPPARKLIFGLYFFEQLSVREIANRLNLTETTVRNQRNRALSFLRQAFFL
jgi:RNA polymerase sigma-70 factor (family 1)